MNQKEVVMKELEKLGYTIDEVLSMSTHSNSFQELCYLIIKNYDNNLEILNNIASFLNISIKDIEEAAYQYKHKTINQEDYRYGIINVSKKKYKEILKYIYDILKCHNTNEIVTLLSSDKYQNFNIRQNVIRLIINDIYKDKAEIIMKQMEIRLEAYYNYVNKNKDTTSSSKTLEEKNTKEAYDMFNTIINDEEIEYIKDIIDKYHIPSQKYKIFFSIWKDEKINGKTLLEHLKDKASSNRKIKFENVIVEKIKKILSLIDEPIQIGKKERYFDYLDFFTYFSGFYNECLQVLKNDFTISKINDEKDKVFSKKIGKLKTIIINSRSRMPKVTPRNKTSFTILEEHEDEAIKTILNNKFNYNNMENTFLSENDKLTIIKELKEAKVPITLYIFELALNKYNNGHLELITDDTIDSYLERVKKK